MPYIVYWVETPDQRYPWVTRDPKPPIPPGGYEVVPGYRLKPVASFANYDRALKCLTELRSDPSCTAWPMGPPPTVATAVRTPIRSSDAAGRNRGNG